MIAATSPLQELLEVVTTGEFIQLHSRFDLDRGRMLAVGVRIFPKNHPPTCLLDLTENSSTRQVRKPIISAADAADAIRRVAALYPKATLQPDSVSVTVQKGSITPTKLGPIVIRAWHEAYGLPIPTLEELAKQAKAMKAAERAASDALLSLLKTGLAGVEEFNQRPKSERSKADLRKADLAGCLLDGVDFAGANLEGANFTGASLVNAQFWGNPGPSRIKGARFVEANLTGAKLGECRGADVDFSRAILKGAAFGHGNFQRTKFVEADLTNASLFRSDLRGADLTDTRLDQVEIAGVKYDEQTRWPKGFKGRSGLVWKGLGPDPLLAPTSQERSRPKPTDFPGFLDRLKEVAEPAKLEKAMSMLKADRFNLFAKVEGDHLVGVVKSQSDPDLVYSCRLADDGTYACCTQNLNICGGLRGSPCKHLLVLIVGLAKAEELDPSNAHDWIQACRGQKPKLDKDTMAETFLRYKGAEAGEVDWRPTETIPEDFYSL